MEAVRRRKTVNLESSATSLSMNINGFLLVVIILASEAMSQGMSVSFLLIFEFIVQLNLPVTTTALIKFITCDLFRNVF